MRQFNFFWITILAACTAKTPHSMDIHHNNLQSETSPYLQQHAQNPVHWQPYSQQVLAEAKAQKKLLIISIGYSSCHWCHVMEHESFEDSAVADLMNEHFVAIKIDREERPDLDNYYMGAVQLMTGRGGWPLNCVALPDGRPIWGGTYLPKNEWMHALQTIQNVYETDSQKVMEYAEKLQNGIAQMDLIEPVKGAPNFDKTDLQDLVENWKRRFDTANGGPDKAPKFPMPNNYQFLLRYGILSGDEKVEEHVLSTLEKMALGGIYDQVGGGFARYSTDLQWKVPHFEKMLYDNAQLISLYSEAFRATKNPLFKNVVEQSIDFLNREMRGEENQYYAALDADTEGEEGKFYTWKKDELQALIPESEWALFEAFYNINARGHWENGNYILLRTQTNAAFAVAHNLNENELEKIIDRWNKTLLKERNKRTRPGLDDKALTAWNAMMVEALCDAYTAIGNDAYLAQAQKTAAFLHENLWQPNGKLWHTYSHKTAKINGFLDDYASTISAWISLYEATGNEDWLREADELMATSMQLFDAGENNLFYFTEKGAKVLSRNIEMTDNVIPASNSIMANNLEKLGILLEINAFRERAKKMAMQVKNDMYRWGESYSNWTNLMLRYAYPSFEVAIVGSNAEVVWNEFQKEYAPNILVVFSKKSAELPFLKNRFTASETRIFVCQDYACKIPVKTTEEAWKQIKN